MSAGSIIIDLLMKTGSFETDTKRAEKRVREMQKAITGSFKSMAGGVAGFAAAFVSVDAVFSGFKNAIDQADKLNDFNQRLGISAEALSGWGYAAKQSGTDLDALGVGLKSLSRNMAEALNPKSQQAGLFKALGVDVKDAEGNLLSLEAVLPKIADSFKALNNETLEAALAQQIFGKSGMELLEFLNQGATGLDAMRERARELGIELSQETLTAADAFNDSITDLQAATQGYFTQLSADLLPALTKLVKMLSDLVSDGTAAADTAKALGFAVDLVSAAFTRLDGFGKVIEGLTQGFTELLHVANAVAHLDFSKAANIARNSDSDALIGQGIAQMAGAPRAAGSPAPVKVSFAGRDPEPAGMFKRSAAEVAAAAHVAEIEKRLNALLSNPGGGSSAKKAKKSSEKSEAEKEAERLKAAYDQSISSLDEQLALVGKNTEAARAYFDVTQGGLAKLTPAEKELVLAKASELDISRERQEQIEKESRAREQQAESVKSLLTDLAFEGELLGKSAEQQEILNNLRFAGVDANSEYGKSIAEATAELQRQRDITATQVDAMDGLRDSAKGFLDDLRDGEGVWDSLKNAADRFADTLWEIAANKLIDQIFGKSGTADGGSAGGWLGTLVGAVFGGGRAGGGDVLDRRAFLVGENGPEMFIPRTAGTVLSSGATAAAIGAGRSLTINQRIDVPRTTQFRTASQVGQEALTAAQRALVRNR